MGDETHDKDFIIKDKRTFDESGEIRQKEEKKTDQAEQASEDKDKSESEEKNFLPEMNFSSFVFSLSTSVMYHFGDFPDPVSQKTEKNLSAAKQTIDILGMLKEKTEGNLDDNEKELLDGMLFELRMRYLKEKEI
jgi:DNA-nicking Smr family endonuclease